MQNEPQNDQNQEQPEMPTSRPPEEPVPGTEPLEPREHMDKDASKNMLVAGVLAVIVVVLALMFIWGSSQTAPMPSTDPVPDPVVEVPVSPSDELGALEADLGLGTPEIDNIDVELEEIERMLDEELESL
jgi:hypothetical protein